MQTLMILRHAKAEPWYPGVNDFDRPLSDIGKQHAARVADWIKQNVALPDAILSSPARRTLGTLLPLVQENPQLKDQLELVQSMYGASVTTLSGLLDAAFAEHQRVLLVGHNPGFERLAIECLAPSMRAQLPRLPTGTLVIVEFEQPWPQDFGRGQLQFRIRGKKLGV